MDGINPGRQCQFDIENSNDLHTTTTTTLYMLSRLTSSFFLKIVVVVVWCCTIYTAQGFRMVMVTGDEWIHIYTLSIRSIYSQKYMKKVERKDFSLDSRISLEPQNPPIGAMTFEKKITEWKKSLDRLENVYFRNIYTRRARWNIDNNKKNEEGIHTYNYQG